MPKRSSKPKRPKRPTDPNQLAAQIVAEATGQPIPGKAKDTDQDEEKTATEARSMAAKMLGRLGGLKGGKARAEKLSKKRRAEIAKKAAKARWGR